MNKILNGTLMVALVMSYSACKSSKKNTSTQVVEPAQLSDAAAKTEPVEVTYADPEQQKKHEQEATNEAAAKGASEEAKTSYAFSVSFFSIGEGTDGKMMDRFIAFIDTFNKDKKVELKYDKSAWGREGEVDYCFLLEELNAKQRVDFIERSKKLLAESKLVHVAENAQCHPGRR